MTITISALKWVPDFAAGQVRDYRARWILNEVGWPYQVRLLDAPAQKSDAYRALQPFGQVPCMEEDGRPPLFESGAIVIDVATRAGKLIPPEGAARAQVLGWVVAALNSVEPFLMNVAEVEYFIKDKELQSRRRPDVIAAAKTRLAALQEALGARDWLVGGEFTIADMMMGSVLLIAERLGLLDDLPALAAYQRRSTDRPAFHRAVAEQRQQIAAHRMEDMRYAEAGHG